ncbi:M-phase phosphoprotein 9-like [Megalops cyprinoides]|uniref:M-phase phosphoprotein 9-like n=1 Tax=Megalops cyprinoides TaxID=118141 RepID=UPI001863F2B2|nr:M-phase phosphoprotein 9-like [Megalops cyprinoides]
MSTDDSISEDISSSVALSQDHAEANGGKESEGSVVSSEDTASALAGPEKERTSVEPVQTLQGILQVATGAVKALGPHTPASNSPHKNRNLCLSAEEFSSGRSLPSINPSSLETLTALVREIQSSGKTDPEIWRDCEGRWLQLFQLVEKQYQEQILAQHEQYQCQIQLIQDEIKALVQLQNRQGVTQPTDGSPVSAPAGSLLTNLLNGSHSGPSIPCPQSATSPRPTQTGKPREGQEEGAVTLLSSGYGTLSTWAPSPRWDEGPAGTDEASRGKGEGQDPPPHHSPHNLSASLTPDSGVIGQESQEGGPNGTPPDTPPANPSPSADQQKVTSQQLTSWVQKRRVQSSRPAQASKTEAKGREERSRVRSPAAQGDCQDDYRSAAPASRSFYLTRSDSLVSDASGLTYWRLDENELYRPLPDSFDSGAYLLLQDMCANQASQEEPKLPVSLKEIYQSKQRGDRQHQDWDSSLNSNASTPQVLTLDPSVHMKQSDRTSGFTSPSLFSSPSSPHQPQGCPPGGAALSPDSMAEGAPDHSHMDTDCTSNSLSTAGTPTQQYSAGTAAAPSTSHTLRRGANSEEGASRATLTPLPIPILRVDPQASICSPERKAPLPSIDDPVMLSLVRQNLREKHSRHIADLRAYYESEINVLKEKLALVNQPLDADLEQSNQSLVERCEHLERALTEASTRIRELENKNLLLERQLAEWPDRYEAASAAVQALQQRLEEGKQIGREKEAAADRLRARLRQLEEALQGATKDADSRDAQIKNEHKMLQDLLAEYDSLRKDHEQVKDSLVSTENKLFDATAQISELKRVISKLESQIKQLEHENLVKTRHVSQSHSQPSGAGLYHHPDMLLSPSKSLGDLDSSRRAWPGSEVDRSAHSRQHPDRPVSHTSRCYSPPEREQPQEKSSARDLARRDAPLTPLMKALVHMDETKGTEGRALHKAGIASSRLGSRRPTVSFVESCVRTPGFLRAQRSTSPEGHRSSSLPPFTRKTVPCSTPTKRDTLITPLSAKSSPKRCPTENYSTMFGDSPTCQLHNHPQFDGGSDQRVLFSSSPSHSSSPRKRLQFMSSEGLEAHPRPSNGTPGLPEPAERVTRSAWEEQEAEGPEPERPDSPSSDVPLPYHAQVQSLADTERLFDELTQEKQQIEAALSRIPSAGGRVTLQARLDEVALEKRLDKVNRDLGSIRMTLKRFHVLRTSANT